MNKEEMQTIRDTGMCDDKPLQWSYFETDGSGFVKAMCQVCFSQFTKSVEIINLDNI